MSLQRFSYLAALFLFCLVSVMLLSYRYFFSLPAIETFITAYQNRELSTLKLALDKEMSFLSIINHDYAVWNDSYTFMQKSNEDFIIDNLQDDTFRSLKIDGIYFYDLNYQSHFAKGYDYKTRTSFKIPELDLISNPSNQNILPYRNKDHSGHVSGFITTSEGPMMFSSSMVRYSNQSDKDVGALLFIRKLRPNLFVTLAELSQLKLTASFISNANRDKHYLALKGSLQGEKVAKQRERILLDHMGKPIVLLTIEHNFSGVPKLINRDALLTLALLGLVCFSISLFVRYYLVEPASRGVRAINEMLLANKLVKLTAQRKFTEIKQLVNDFNLLVDKINQQKRMLEKLSLVDALTGISNRRAFDTTFELACQNAARSQSKVGLILCDIDYFKPYNDFYGHQKGDETLTAVAQGLAASITRSTDLAARYGGEEFVVLLSHSSEDEIILIAEKIQIAIKTLAIVHQKSAVADHVTLSMGTALLNFNNKKTGQCKKHLLKQADEALYKAKKAGRNQVCHSFLATDVKIDSAE